MSEDTRFVASNKNMTIFEFRSEVDNHLAPNVTLISSDDAKVKGHSIILGSCHYFRELFKKDKTGNSHLVFHQNFTGDVLEFVVKYIYTGEYSLLDVEKLQKVIKATSKEKFNIPALAKGYLLKQLDASEGLNQANWHIFYKNGIKLSLGEEYCNRIYAFLKEKHPEFYKCEEFKSLTFNQICKIIKSPNRPFVSNITLTEASLIWTTENTEVGMDKLAELSKICTNPIQNGNISPQVANSMPILDEQAPVQSTEDSLSTPTCPQPTAKADHLSTARKRSISPKINNLNSKRLNKRPNLNGIARNPPSISTLSPPAQSAHPQGVPDPTPSTSTSTRMKTRANSQKNGTPNPNSKESVVDVYNPPKYSWDSAQLLFFGQTEESESRYLWSYSFQTGGIKKMAKLPMGNYRYSSMFLARDQIYSIGGRGWARGKWIKARHMVQSFGTNDLENLDKDWEEHNPSFNCEASRILFRNTIYQFGSYDSRIEKWDMATPGRENIDKQMLYDRKSFGIALLDNTIYMIGGKGTNRKNHRRRKVSKVLNISESYNIDDGTQSLLPKMNEARWYLQVVALEDRIYAIGGYKDNYEVFSSVESYKPGDPSWTQVASMNQPRASGSAFVLDDMIYVVGGNEGEELTMERYFPQEDRWTMVDANLPEWAELSSAVLLGPNNF